jgi:hypothetical protein
MRRNAGTDGAAETSSTRATVLTLDVDVHFSVDVCQRSQMGWKPDLNHGRVWASTDRTAGRSRTMSAQLSPPSGDTYTWPPVVPK